MFKKEGRGAIQELQSSNEKVVLTQWFDSKIVKIGSNFVGAGIVTQKEKWDKKNKLTVSLNVPDCVNVYNQGMGGVDVFDQQMSYYRIQIKSVKWSQRIVNHFLELAVNNSYLEYRNDLIKIGQSEKDIPDRNNFFKQIAQGLMSAIPKGRGRPAKTTEETDTTLPVAKRQSFETRPTEDIRLDNHGHLPIFTNKTRCKNYGCNRTTTIQCSKCNVHYCLLPSRNCFFEAHSQ